MISDGRLRAGWRFALAAVAVPQLVAACAAGVTPAAVGVTAPTAAIATNTSQFKGVNWADPRDNYADGVVVPSGLSISDSYATAYAKATAIITGFETNLGANTVRLPINPSSVNGAFWASYSGAIDAATAKGFNVILSYWEGAAHKDGVVDDISSYWAMWQTVTTKYAGNSRVYFEPMNEPFGYSKGAWANFAARWIHSYPDIPRSRIFVSGTGYNDNVTTVCADSRLAGTFLSLHVYGFWNTNLTAYAGWVDDLRKRIGSCAARTVVDEWGAPMRTGLNYNGPINSNGHIAYLQAATDVIHTLNMGAVYWPGLRNGDSYSMETLRGTGTNLTLVNNSATGVSRLQWAWGAGAAAAVVRTAASNQCLDVPRASTSNGTQVGLLDCNGRSNQSWLLTPSRTLVVYGNKCLGVAGGVTAAGSRVEIRDCNGNTSQQWNVNSTGTITGVGSGLCLTAVTAGTGNGTRVDIETCNGESNQRWTRAS